MADRKKDSGFSSVGAVLPGLELAARAQSVGPELPKPRPGQKTTRAGTKLAAAAAEIIAQPDQADAAYLARELVQCTLPHRDPGNVAVWVRRNGNYALGLQPGTDLKTKQTIGLPYGSIPRLILLWIVTEAIRTKSREIKLGNTLNEFLREIGLDPRTGGGKRSDAKRLRDQMMRLFRCRISFEYSEESRRQSWLDMQVAPKGEFWWDFKDPGQAALFESHIVLGEDFFKAITAAPVPVDLRALLPLKQSPLAIDLYTWASYRLYMMQRRREDQIHIPLRELKEQFGSEYNRANNFKAAFGEALAKVKEVLPALDYSFEKGSLVVYNTHRRPAVAPSDKTAAQRRLAELRPYDLVTEKARQWFKSQFPGMDPDAAIQDFYAWRNEKGEASGNTDAHFRAFAKTWNKHNG